MFSFIFTFFDLYEKYGNKVMDIRILLTNFKVLCFDIDTIPILMNIEIHERFLHIIKVGPIMCVNFVL